MPEIKIRKLIRKDRRIVSSMILNLIDTVGDTGLLDIIKSDSPKKTASKIDNSESTVELGIKIIKLLLQTLETDTTEWFASLINVKPEEFDEQPLDVEIQIIKQLKEAKEIHDFFSGASQQFSMIQQWYNMLKKEKRL